MPAPAEDSRRGVSETYESSVRGRIRKECGCQKRAVDFACGYCPCDIVVMASRAAPWLVRVERFLTTGQRGIIGRRHERMGRDRAGRLGANHTDVGSDRRVVCPRARYLGPFPPAEETLASIRTKTLTDEGARIIVQANPGRKRLDPCSSRWRNDCRSALFSLLGELACRGAGPRFRQPDHFTQSVSGLETALHDSLTVRIGLSLCADVLPRCSKLPGLSAPRCWCSTMAREAARRRRIIFTFRLATPRESR